LSYLPKCRDSVWACKKLYLEYKTVDFQLKCEDTKGVVQAVNREKDRQYNIHKKKNKQWSTKHYTEEKDRQYNNQKKKNKQWSTKHYTEEKRLINNNSVPPEGSAVSAPPVLLFMLQI
jgi:hypothetical protein